MNPPRYTFEATFPDGSPRRYVGLYRPPFDEWFARPGNPSPLWYHVSAARDRWMTGEADRPLYAVEADEETVGVDQARIQSLLFLGDRLAAELAYHRISPHDEEVCEAGAILDAWKRSTANLERSS